ncbi:MAG: UDP-N-acetylglucosamine 1-carboxyvinyltransferase [Mycoplasmatales bacterium]
MRYFKIEGNKKLSGSVQISGAKNSVLALIIASTMTDKVVTIEDIPDIKDVKELVKILKFLGSNVIISQLGPKKSITIDNNKLEYKELIIDEITTFRASYYFMGAMIGRYKKCKLLLPGGCFLGPRPIDLHLMGFKALGCEINQYEEKDSTTIEFNCPNGLKGNKIFLDFPSVGATINLMLAASFASGETIIENAAKEPEIVDIATLLNNMGVKIKGAGTNEIRIHGIEELHGCYHQVVPDRIEAGTYLMIGAILGENFTIENIIPEHLEALVSKLEYIGINLRVMEDSITILGRNDILVNTNIKTGVFPSFATDLQQVFVTLLTQVEGESLVVETIYPDRFRHCDYLNLMGANIDVQHGEDMSKANIIGPSKLYGSDVMATDLRAGAALIFAGLIAEGTTHVSNVAHILRGYDSIVEKLTAVGASIELLDKEKDVN